MGKNTKVNKKKKLEQKKKQQKQNEKPLAGAGGDILNTGVAITKPVIEQRIESTVFVSLESSLKKITTTGDNEKETTAVPTIIQQDEEVPMEIDDRSIEDEPEEFQLEISPPTESMSCPTSPVTLITCEKDQRQVDIQIISESIQKTTILKDGSGFLLTKFPDGYNIFQAHSGPKDRNIELFTQRRSTHMSSFALAQDNMDLVGAVDFMGNAECFKELFRSQTNTHAMSFLIHRVGDTKMIDDFDLMTILWPSTEQLGYNDSNELVRFVRHCIPQQERKLASFGWRTSETRENKNAMHHLFYACMKGQEIKFKEVETAIEKVKLAGRNRHDKPVLKGADTKFLSTNLWTFGKRTFLIGSNVPTFLVASDDDEDEPYTNCVTTLGINSPAVSEKVTEWNGIDMWFNNMSLGADQTYICHQEDCKLLRSEFVKTDNIPQLASFNVGSLCSDFQTLLDSIDSCVNTPGNSYWMYRAPGSEFLRIHDVTQYIRHIQPGTSPYPIIQAFEEFDLSLVLKRAELVRTFGKTSDEIAPVSGSSAKQEDTTRNGEVTRNKGTIRPFGNSNGIRSENLHLKLRLKE